MENQALEMSPAESTLTPNNSSSSLAEIVNWAPEQLLSRLRAVADDLQLAYAANTQRAWLASWRVWIAFCTRTRSSVLPATVDSLRHFLNERIGEGRKRATLELNLSTLAMVHRLMGLPWPLDTMEGKLMWRALRRAHLSARQQQAQGLTLDVIEQLLEPMSMTTPIDVRDAALLCVAYETMCRRSELISLQVEQLSLEADGTARLLLERSKTDQEGEGVLFALSRSTVERLQRWLTVADIHSGALFRSTPRSHQVNRFAAPLFDRDISRIYKRRALAIGMDPTRISGHSTRVGPAQDLLAANFSGAEVMRQGRWKSERMVVRYGEQLEAGRGAMAQMLYKRRQKKLP